MSSVAEVFRYSVNHSVAVQSSILPNAGHRTGRSLVSTRHTCRTLPVGERRRGGSGSEVSVEDRLYGRAVDADAVDDLGGWSDWDYDDV